jgi:menaquinol-cytochrome c reductase iron-sulfur subunit
MSAGAEHPAPADPARRRFVTGVSLAVAGVAGLVVAVPSVWFLLGLRRVPNVWTSIGPIGDFRVGETTLVAFDDPSPLPWAGVTSRTAAWLRRQGEQDFITFAVNCTHLGCPVRWLPDAELFMCPCHGGVYYQDGTVASGPPPRPLIRYPTRVESGVVQILTSPLPITG